MRLKFTVGLYILCGISVCQEQAQPSGHLRTEYSSSSLGQSAGQVRGAPHDWKTIATERFDLHYYDDAYVTDVREMGGWFEQAAREFETRLGFKLTRRVDIFIFKSVHDLDRASILGTEFGKLKPDACHLKAHRTWAFAEPTQNRIFMALQPSYRWRQWFCYHELTHIFQFEDILPWRIPSYLLAVKDPLIPVWMWEGFADYNASIFEANKDAYVRDLVRDKSVYSLPELFDFETLNEHDFIAPYYEGSYFFKYLETISPDAPVKVLREYGSSFPLTMGRILKNATGKSMGELESGFNEFLKKNYEKREQGTARPTEVLAGTDRYYRVQAAGARCSPDGKRIAYLTTEDSYSDIIIQDLATGKRTAVFGNFALHRIHNVYTSPSWSFDGKRICFGATWVHRDYIYVVDAESGGVLSETAPEVDEVYSPAFHPDGSVWFSGMKNGRTDIYSPTSRMTDSAAWYDSPSFGPDGSQMAFTAEKNGTTDLCIMDMDLRTVKRVTDCYALVESPKWLWDGKSIVFTCDYGGVYNIFSYDVQSGEISRLTNVPSRAGAPDICGDSLIFTYFEKRTTKIYRAPIAKEKVESLQEESRKQEFAQFYVKSDEKFEMKEFSSPWRLTWFTFPWNFGLDFGPGAQVLFQDALGENLFGFGGTYLGHNAWTVQSAYANTRWRPTMGVVGAVAGLEDITAYSSEAFFNYPFTNNFSGNVGWFYSLMTAEPAERDELNGRKELSDIGPLVGLRYSTGTAYNLFDPQHLFSVSTSARFGQESFGGDRNFDVYSGSVSFAYPFVQDLVGFLRTSGVTEKGEAVDSELIRMDTIVRATDLNRKSSEAVFGTAELRFPIYRDLLFAPFGFMGASEFLVFKDLRGFFFGDGGALTDGGTVWTAGAGIRIDTFLIPVPILFGRIPIRLEIFYGRDFESEEWNAGITVTIPGFDF